MTKRVIHTDRLMRPIAHFSHAVRIGNLIHVGATAGTDAQRRLAGDAAGLVDVAAQTRRMFDNVGVVLELLGARIEDTVRIKTYITDLRDEGRYREIYAERMGGFAPNHVVVGSHGFPLPQAAIELDLVAMVDTPIARLPSGDAIAGERFYGAASAPFDDDAAAAAAAALSDLKARAASSGFAPTDIIYIHASLADVRDTAAFVQAFEAAFPDEPPACAVVVAPLPGRSGIQIEAVAARGGGQRLAAPGGVGTTALGAPAVLAGDDLYIGGQLGTGAQQGVTAGTESQTRAAWDRVRALLDAAGFERDTILRTNNVLVDWRDYAAFNAGYGANVSEPYPPRATVLGGLARRDARVQVEAIAHRQGGTATIVQVPG
ncbi:RidA family protein [Reyranella sp.]|uniref:RidA family protein n=1 Tax=Reyranella sp. TaxID=1929291 RepID=UPI003BA978F3